MTHHRTELLARLIVRELTTRTQPIPLTEALAILAPYCDPSRALQAIRHAVTRGQLIEHDGGSDGPHDPHRRDHRHDRDEVMTITLVSCPHCGGALHEPDQPTSTTPALTVTGGYPQNLQPSLGGYCAPRREEDFAGSNRKSPEGSQ